MSQLQRLNIFGIRSFGPEEQDLQKIKFFSPLTLIQGQNGCGKTTIIEAIKFAITGELPAGSARGQGFVYDPKLAKVFESRGQVKLRVCDTKGDQVTVTKTVAVTQKAKEKLEFKRVDSTIGRGKPGEVEHTSGKCIDIDSEMCLALGVSKPILNNVIFCHQEDSNWPLDESSKLKVKFDEIFDATKYNKCILAITKYIKHDMNTKKIYLSNEVSNLKENKIYVQSKRDLLQEKQEKLDTLIEEITVNKVKQKTLNTRIEELYKTEKNFSQLCAEVEIKKKDIDNLKQQQKDLLKNMEEFQGTDEELQIKITQFEEDLQSLQTDIEVLLKKKKGIEDQEKKLRQTINEHQNKLGSLQAEEKQNNNKKNSRNKLLTKSIKDFELSNKEENFDEFIQEIMSELNEKLEHKKVSVDLLESSIKQEENMLQDDIDKIREEHAKIKHNIQLKTTNISELKDEFRKIQHEIELLNSAGDQLKLSDAKINRFEKEITSLESSVNVNNIREEIDSEKKNNKTLEDRLSDVDMEVQTLQQFTSKQTELDLKNENLLSKQTELQKLKNKHEKSLNKIFENIPNSDLKKNVENFQLSQNKLTKQLTNQINEKQRDVMKFESNLNNLREKISEKQKELTSNQEKLSVHCEDKNLEEVIDITQNLIKKLQQEKGMLHSSIFIYRRFIENIEKDTCCPICKRDVEGQQLTNEIVADLSKKIETFPNLQKETETKLSIEQKKYDTLLSLRPLSEKLQKLQNELPNLKTDFENLEIKFKNSSEELETLKTDIKLPQENEKIVNSLIGDVSLIDQLQKDIAQIKQEISTLNLLMPKNESNRGIQEALNEQESLKSDIKKSRNNIESLQTKLSRHVETLQRLKEEKNNLVTQQLKIKQSLQGKDNLITKSIEIESKISELKTEIQDLEIEVKNSTNTLQASVKHKVELQNKNKTKMDDARKYYNSLQNIIVSITQCQKEIDEFTKKDTTNQIKTINETVQKTKQQIDDYSTKKTKIDSNVDELKSQISNSKINFRELQDNVTLRDKKTQQIKLEKQLIKLEQDLGDNDISAIRKERIRLSEKEDSLQQVTLRAEGEKTQLTIQIKEITDELAVPKNAQVNLNYKKKFLELKLHERATNDLKSFVKSMDWALMQFHKQRMIQVNAIIKELWRSIYKGNDIDYIEIQTSDGTTGTDKRKTYNYGIMQVKNEAELDMRGRCSAGQRVLASLIIRIALSETFSTNCGILALDEPTTNLDRENIHSLCDALIELIMRKRQQKNFQLLIITHDQDFVDRLTRSESLEQYYVIRRNEHGKSVISLNR